MMRFRTGMPVIILSAVCAVGCNRIRPAVIPLQETAELQYGYCRRFMQESALVLLNWEDPERLLRRRDVLRQCYAGVVEHFPEDRDVTPVARVQLADMMAGLDMNEIRPKKRDIRSAIGILREIRADYPEYDFIQAKTRYDESLCWRRLKEYEKAQKLFKDIDEMFGEHEDRVIRSIAAQARVLYQQTYF